MSGLNEGTGRCQGTARLMIKPVRAVIELGAAEDVLTTALRAVHHANRHGVMDDFIAVALPSMRMGRDAMLPGHELELIGSGKSLTALLGLDGIMSLQRRGMLETTQVDEVFVELGMVGAAYIRDRACERHTSGWVRRSHARAQRRGKPVGKPVRLRDNDTKTLMLSHGNAVLHIREQIGAFTNAALMVNTYGFSGMSVPAILPVFPESARDAEDAA